MNTTQVLTVVNKVFNQYGVQVNAEYGVDAPALAMILTTKIFEEAVGVNKPAPARRPAPTKQEPSKDKAPDLKESNAKINISKTA